MDQGFLAVPFVLHVQPTAIYDDGSEVSAAKIAGTVRQRYAEIMRDVEGLIKEHSMSLYFHSRYYL